MGDAENTPPSTRGVLRSAIQAAKAGRRQEARQLLQQVVEADPSNQVAWLWLAGLAEQPDQAAAALARVAQLNPRHPRLAAAQAWAQTRLKAEPDTQYSPPFWSRRWLWLAGGLGLLALICLLAAAIWLQADAVQARPNPSPTSNPPARLLALQPELNAAVSESRWEDAAAVLQVMLALEPDNPVLQRQLAQVYYQVALGLRDRGDLESALAALDGSLALVPGDLSIQKERRLLAAYAQGVQRHQSGDWQGTIQALALVQVEDPAYLDAIELLYSARYNLGLSQQAAGDLRAAQASYEVAVQLLPDEPLAREKAAEVARLLQPPTPTPAPTPSPTPQLDQRIVVDISEQRMVVYEGDRVRWKWVISTGEPGRDTAIGNFAIQSKIPMAYASTWNLDMPYWLGIYWSGPLENGIHALPIVRHTGYKLWDGFLGQRVSYGCVILSDEHAEMLFEWVRMGTPVVIQP